MKWFITGMEKLIHGKKSRKIVSGFLISLLVVTLVFSLNTRVALADDFEVVFYSASENPISGSFTSATLTGSSLDSGYLNTLDKYGYVDYLVSYRVVYTFNGAVAGNAFKYRPTGNFQFNVPTTPNLTGFQYDQIFLDSYTYRGIISDVEITTSTGSSTPKYQLPMFIAFLFDWIDVRPGDIAIDLNFIVRMYANDTNSVDLYSLGQLNITPTFTQFGTRPYFNQVGAFIANFSMYSGMASQFSNSSLMTGYLYEIRNALVQQPDTEYTAAIDSAQSALDTEQDARDDVFQQVDQFYMTDADTLLTLDDIDSNVGVGLDFWFDWVNAYFNKAEEVDANKPLTLNIIFNFISRLF